MHAFPLYWRGGYAEFVRAFAQTKPDAGKLTDYCEAIDNNAATRRIGFLAELLEKRELEDFVQFARTKVNCACNLFDPLGRQSGEIASDWNLRLNITKENIRAIVENHY